MWEERKKKKYEDELGYILNLFTSYTIEGIIIKIDASEDGDSDYKEKTGVNFLEEETLILGDDDNDAFLIFRKEKDKVASTKDITKNIHVINSYNFESGSIIHKKCRPAKVPNHLRAHLALVNVNIYNNIVNNFNNMKISPEGEEDFFSKNYKKGGMCSLKQMKRHPEWKDEYENKIETKRVHICKSCKGKWMKDCCEDYSRKNRVMLKMVVGWQE